MSESKVLSRGVPRFHHRTLAVALALAAVQVRAGTADSAAPPGLPSSSIVGEVASVDLGRRSLTLKVESPSGELREIELPLDDQSRIVSGGRILSLDQVRSGVRAVARCASPDARGRRNCWVRIRRMWPARVPPS